MESILYLANDAITLMKGYKKTGKYFVMDTKRIPYEGGAITSLDDLDDEKIGSFLNKINVQSVCLLLSMKFIQWKIAEIPNIKSENMIRNLVKQEMEDLVTQDKKYVYDYRMLKKQGENGQRIMMYAVQEDIVEYAIEMAEKYRLKLTRIDIVMNAVIKVYQDFVSERYATVGFLVVEGKEVNTYLFIDGKFSYFGKSQIRSQHDSEQFPNELVSHVSQLIQFKRANYRESNLEKIFFAGVKKDVFQNVANVLRSLFQLEVGKYEEFAMIDEKSQDISEQEWLYQLGSLGEWK